MTDEILAYDIAKAISDIGGLAYYVGGSVRDRLMGIPVKDIDIEVYNITPQRLREALSAFGEVFDKGASFGVLGIRHTDIDIAMPRRESRTGAKHTDFDVSVDPFMTTKEASSRRDFTINAMLYNPLTGEITDEWGGQSDIKKKLIRHVSDATFIDDALRAFRAAQFAARLEFNIADETMDICRRMDVSELSRERVFEELIKALMKSRKPSVFFRTLRDMDKLEDFFPEIKSMTGVMQNPKYHPEGDVFEHTMLVLDSAANLRDKAKEPINFMLAALMHDLGKTNATEVINGKITSYMHPITGVNLAETQLKRLTNNARTIAYVKNMVSLHMRPNMLANSNSKKLKSRTMYDMSLCPEDLVLLSRADEEGKTDAPYNEAHWTYLTDRLNDYKDCLTKPMVTGDDFINAGIKPGKVLGEMMKRARKLHFSGITKDRALSQILREARKNKTTEDV